MTITLTTQQAEGLEKVKTWYDSTSGDAWAGDVFRWFGYAGTGKTFTAARIPEALGLDKVVFGTYTGKAASVLRKSLNRYGVTAPVTTIHSAIYMPTTSAEARKALDKAREDLRDLLAVRNDGTQEMTAEETATIASLETKLPQLEANAKRLRFEFNPMSEWASADLIILDEVSMVNAKVAADIESYGVPVLVLGDPAQLPPVEGGGYYTDAEPNHLLTEIQRAALDSPVTALATRIRQSGGTGFGLVGLEPGDVTAPSIAAAEKADVVLVWTNKRRWAMVHAIRKKRGIGHGFEARPVPGDVIMVLTNNKDAAVFNGELFTVSQVGGDPVGFRLTVVSDTGVERPLAVYREGFAGQEEQTRAKNSGMGMRGERVLATFGQAITVHKAQGSEWPHVYVVNEVPNMVEMVAKREGRKAALGQARSWLYTAVTRASERITVTAPR